MRHAIAALFVLIGLCAGPSARADVRLIDHYKHTVWTFENGAPAGVFAFAQSRDGYLWIGANSGLSRFDGVQFERIPPQSGRHAPSQEITALLAARTGEIWVGHYWGGVSVYKNGQLVDANPAKPNGVVYKIVQDRDGGIWVASDGIRKAGLRHYLNGKWDIVDKSWGLPAQHLSDIMAARDGSLWVALTSGMLHLARGARRFTFTPMALELGTALSEGADGRVWLLNSRGVSPLAAGVPVEAPPSENGVRNQYRLIADSRGQLWLGGGSLHGTAVLQEVPASIGAIGQQIDKLSERRERAVSAFMEDREGNIWVGNSAGIERYRRADVVTFITDPGTSDMDNTADSVTSVKDTVFAKTRGSASLYAIDRHAAPHSLAPFRAEISSFCDDRRGGLWVILANGEIVHVVSKRVTNEHLPRVADGEFAGKCAVDGQGHLWIAAAGAGLFFYEQNSWHRFDVTPELKGVWPYSLASDQHGRILAYYGTRDLVQIDAGRVSTVWRRDENSIGLIKAMYPAKGNVWLVGDAGLAIYDGEVVRVLPAARLPSLSHFSGIAETANGTTWLVAEQGIGSLPTRDLLAAFGNTDRVLTPRIFNTEDGMHDAGASMEYASNEAAVGSDGRLWFAVADGIVSIDPANLAHNSLPPTVLISGLAIGYKSLAQSTAHALPAGTSNLRIDYTATSLTIPERVQFRYRLQGVDADWVNPGHRRQAFYTNLGPGSYTFQVLAANNDGVWNKKGATITFSIPPTFLQSTLFKAIVVLAIVAVLAFLYQQRLRALERTMRIRAEERLTERERIARELHDTLLQGFQALVLRLQNVIDQMPATEVVRVGIEQELERAEATLAEGRNRVHDIRSESSRSDIEALFGDAAHLAGAAKFTFSATGTVRDLRPLVRDELCKIGLEAIQNASRHAAAKNIEARVVYGRTLLLLNVSDDGVGIAPETLSGGGRADRYGLVGMRERAQRIQSKFKITSIVNSGTTIEVAVPARIAYVTRSGWLQAFQRSPVLGS